MEYAVIWMQRSLLSDLVIYQISCSTWLIFKTKASVWIFMKLSYALHCFSLLNASFFYFSFVYRISVNLNNHKKDYAKTLYAYFSSFWLWLSELVMLFLMIFLYLILVHCLLTITTTKTMLLLVPFEKKCWFITSFLMSNVFHYFICGGVS